MRLEQRRQLGGRLRARASSTASRCAVLSATPSCQRPSQHERGAEDEHEREQPEEPRSSGRSATRSEATSPPGERCRRRGLPRTLPRRYRRRRPRPGRTGRARWKERSSWRDSSDDVGSTTTGCHRVGTSRTTSRCSRRAGPRSSPPTAGSWTITDGTATGTFDWEGLHALRAAAADDRHPLRHALVEARHRPGAACRSPPSSRPWGVGDLPYALVTSYGGYTTNLDVEDLIGRDAMVAVEFEGEQLRAEHGGPARLLVPHLYLWKSAKWVTRDSRGSGVRHPRLLGGRGLPQPHRRPLPPSSATTVTDR